MSQSLLEVLLQKGDFSRKSRLPSLYSDFSPLIHSNKDGYEANVSAWLSALNAATYECPELESHISITANLSLSNALTSPQWGKALALATIEREARQRQIWMSSTEFLAKEESIYTMPTLFSRLSIGSVLQWGVSKIFTSSQSTRLSGAQYVSIPNLERLCVAIETARRKEPEKSYSDSITTPSLFKQWISETCGITLNDSDLRILLTFLKRDKSMISTRDMTIKFSTLAVNESDVAVSQLKETIALTAKHMASLESHVASLSALLKTQLESKVLAMGTLRRRKLADCSLARAVERHGECIALLDKIDEGVNQVTVVEGLEKGSLALGLVLAQIGGVERVENVIDRIKEQTEEVNDIGQAIAGASTAETDDVEEEYAALLHASRPVPEVSEPVGRQSDQISESAEGSREDERPVEAESLEREAILA